MLLRFTEMKLALGVLDCSDEFFRIVCLDDAGHGFFQVGARKSGLLQEGHRSSRVVLINSRWHALLQVKDSFLSSGRILQQNSYASRGIINHRC